MLRRHNQPGCTCDFPIACGLTPRWFDRTSPSDVGKPLYAGLLVYYVYESVMMYGWLISFLAIGLPGIALGGLLLYLRAAKRAYYEKEIS